MTEPAFVKCYFSLREPGREDGTFRYTTLPVGPGGRFPTPIPPQVGDRIVLPPHGLVRVVDLQWVYPEYGSELWRGGQEAPRALLLDLIVERAEGVYTREEPYEEREAS